VSTLSDELGHLKHHVNYPATTKEINEACSNMSDVPEPDRNWFQKTLPEGNYANPEEVVSALLETL